MLRKNITLSIIATLILLLHGCGFQLRQPATTATVWQNLYIHAPNNNYKNLCPALVQYFRAAGNTVTDHAEQALVILNLIHEERGKILRSVNSSQQTMQYNLTLTVSFEVVNRVGKALLQRKTLTENMPITLTVNEIVSSTTQIEQTYQIMEHNIAYSIFLYLTTVKHPDPKQIQQY